MDVLAIEAAYGAFEGDEDVECAIALADRCLLRASNIPAGRERRRIIAEATDELCIALERNILQDPDFVLPHSSRGSVTANRTSSRKRLRPRKVIIVSSDSDASEGYRVEDKEKAEAAQITKKSEAMEMTEEAETLDIVSPSARRSTRLAENLEKEVALRNRQEEASIAQETAPAPVQEAEVSDADSSTSTLSDTRELVLPVVRPKPQVPPRPLVSDRASQTPLRTAEDEDTEEEEERSRRAHAPRSRHHPEPDASGELHDLSGPDYSMEASTDYERVRVRNQFSSFSQANLIASPIVARPELPQPQMPDVVMGGANPQTLPANQPIAMPVNRTHATHGQRLGLNDQQLLPSPPENVPGQRAPAGPARQPANGMSDIEAEIHAARASISEAQEQQNNWIQSLNAEQAKRMREAQLYAQQQSTVPVARASGTSVSNVQTSFPHLSQTHGLQPGQPPQRIVPDINKAGQQAAEAFMSAQARQNYSVPQDAQNRSQQLRQTPPTANVGAVRGVAPVGTLPSPSARPEPRAFSINNSMQLQILQENMNLEEQNNALAQLLAQQTAQLHVQGQQKEPVPNQRQQLLRQQILQQQQQQIHMQLQHERLRRVREEQEKKKLEEQMKELEKQQQQIQERKKLILQQQIALQQRHLRDQQLQQQRMQQQLRVEEQQRHHQLQAQQRLRASDQLQLLGRTGLKRQQIQQQQILQQRLQSSHRQQIQQQQQQIRQALQPAQQQTQGGYREAQQLRRSQGPQGITLNAIPPSSIPLGKSKAPRQANISSMASAVPAQVASLSTALFSLNGVPDTRAQPRAQAIPASATGSAALLAPSSAQPSVLLSSTTSQYQNPSSQRTVPDTRTSVAPPFQASSAAVGGTVHSVMGNPGTNGYGGAQKNGPAGGSAPQVKKELLMNLSGTAGPTSSLATRRVGAEVQKRGPGRPRKDSSNQAGLSFPSMTRLADGTLVQEVPLTRRVVNVAAEVQPASSAAALASAASSAAAPPVRRSKRDLLLWDAVNLGGKNKRKKK